MKYRIKHENFLFIIVCLISTLLCFGFIFLETVETLPLWILFVLIGVAVLSAILYFLEQIIGTRIVIKNNCMIIYYFLWIKKIPLNEIYNVNIEQYQRYRRKPYPHYNYRLRLVINVLNGKDIKLTDDATKKQVFKESERKPNEEVQLYQAYMQISNSIPVTTFHAY